MHLSHVLIFCIQCRREGISYLTEILWVKNYSCTGIRTGDVLKFCFSMTACIITLRRRRDSVGWEHKEAPFLISQSSESLTVEGSHLVYPTGSKN